MRIVVTGLGVVSSLGNSIDVFWDNIMAGRNTFGPMRSLNVWQDGSHPCAEIQDFAFATDNKININFLDRIQITTLGASIGAWYDAGFDKKHYQPEELGIVLGSTYGYIDSTSKFYLEALKQGPAYVSPIQFTNTVMNAPAGKISIYHNIKGLCSTIATGEVSGLDALIYARDAIRTQKCKALMAGAGGILCEGICLGFDRTGRLANCNDGIVNWGTPFEAKCHGIVLGEGAAIMALERLEDALKRDAKIIAEVKGVGRHFRSNRQSMEEQVESSAYAMSQAIEDAGLTHEEITMVSTSANSDRDLDNIEARALLKCFGNNGAQPAITAVKSMTGECLDGSAAIQSIVAACAIDRDQIPAIPNLENPLSDELDFVRTPRKVNVDAVLVNAISFAGQKAAMVFTKYTAA